MSSSNIQFYNNKPSLNELVLVTFSEQKETHFDGKLLEYPYEIFMTLNNATKKRRITSWKNIVPLDKPILARVDDISDKIIGVSLLYIYTDETKESKEDQLKKLLEPFNKNKQLVSIFIHLGLLYNVDVQNLWNNIMYVIDIKRHEEYDQEDLPILLDYCVENTEFVKSIFETRDDYDFYIEFKKSIDKIYVEKSYKIVSKIQIISTGGVQNTILLLKKAFENISYNYSLKYETASLMTFETQSNDSTEKDHSNLVEFIKEEGNKLNPKTFIKCEKTVRV